MKLSEYGLKIVEELEAFSAEPYNDEAGNATIGYGDLMHYGPVRDDEKNIRWTLEHAETELRNKVAKYEKALNSALKVEVNQNQFDALLIWTYNCGIGALRQCSWLKEINKKNFSAVPGLMRLWNKVEKNKVLVVSPGLINRREKEVTLFNKPVSQEVIV